MWVTRSVLNGQIYPLAFPFISKASICMQVYSGINLSLIMKYFINWFLNFGQIFETSAMLTKDIQVNITHTHNFGVIL